MENKPKAQKNSKNSENKKGKIDKVKVINFISAGIWALTALTYGGSTYNNAQKQKSSTPYEKPDLGELVQTGKVKKAQELCVKDDEIYRLTQSKEVNSYTPLTEEKFEILANSIIFDTNYTKEKIKSMIDDLQQVQNINLELQFDPKAPKIPVQKLADAIIAFKTTTTSYGQKRLFQTLILHNSAKIHNNKHVENAAAYYTQRTNENSEIENIMGLDLNQDKYFNFTHVVTHELHHFGSEDYRNARICKTFLDLKTAELNDEEINTFFNKLQQLENDNTDVSDTVYQDLKSKKYKFAFNNQSDDFSIIYNNYLQKELMGSKRLNYKDYYIYFGLKDLAFDIMDNAISKLTPAEKSKLGIKNLPNYPRVSDKSIIEDFSDNDEIMSVSVELQNELPTEDNSAQFLDSLVVTAGKFDNSAFFDSQYLSLRLKYISLIDQTNESKQEDKTKLQNECWELAKQMEEYLKKHKSPFKLNNYFKNKETLSNIVIDSYQEIKQQKYFAKHNLAKYYKDDLLNSIFNSLDNTSKEALSNSMNKEDLAQAEQELLKFQQENQINVNVIPSEDKLTEPYKLFHLRRFLLEIKSTKLFYDTIKKGDTFNIHLGYINETYTFNYKNSKTIGLNVEQSNYTTNARPLIYAQIDHIRKEKIDESPNLILALKFIKNYEANIPIDDVIQRAKRDKSQDYNDLNNLQEKYFSDNFSISFKDNYYKYLHASLIQAAKSNNSNFFDPEYTKARLAYARIADSMEDYYIKRTPEQSAKALQNADKQLAKVNTWHNKPSVPFDIDKFAKVYNQNLQILKESENTKHNLEEMLKEDEDKNKP
jgi:hypothetical protein